MLHSFIKLDQKVVSYNKAIWLPHQQLIYSTFKKKIIQLIKGGFFDHWMDPYFKHRSILDEEVVDDKVVLAMNHLLVHDLARISRFWRLLQSLITLTHSTLFVNLLLS